MKRRVEQRAASKVHPRHTVIIRNVLYISFVQCAQWHLSRCSAERFNLNYVLDRILIFFINFELA